MTDNKKLRDRIATAAMNAIIGKIPLMGVNFPFDVGQVDKGVDEKYMIMRSVAQAAYAYADCMLEAREE